ncbi:hypothetical protein VKT23_019814 [Stygiomarasmius scandens]|uniref:Pheromone n=1 Tax=Marasmiellus scandens TaxID=2682957 RepID=A0ABR1IPQ3_9AGAR
MDNFITLDFALARPGPALLDLSAPIIEGDFSSLSIPVSPTSSVHSEESLEDSETALVPVDAERYNAGTMSAFCVVA